MTRNRNTPKQIKERRDKISILLARGYSQFEIIDELKISRKTYNTDMKNINKASNKQFYELAKSNPLTVFSNYVNDLEKLMKEGWKIYNDPATNANDKLLALRTISEVNDRKLTMSQEMLDNYHDRDMT